MKYITILLLINLTVVQKVAAECNVYLTPQDKTSKFIEALNCLNREIIRLRAGVNRNTSSAEISKASAGNASAMAEAAERAANRAARAAESTNSKLERMFKKSMMK